MKQLQSFTALLCALLMAAPLPAQDDAHRIELGPQKWHSRFTQKYEPRIVRPINLGNSGRLESLIRAGRIYLSLQDAVALALENNVDIEVQRYLFQINETGLYKAEAGGNGLPNYDPVLTSNLQWAHNTQIATNTTLSAGSTSIVTTAKTANFGVQQGFKTGGNATFSFNNNLAQQNTSGPSINPNTNAFFDLQVTQPLLQGFGMALNNRNIRVAKNNLRATDFTFEQQVINTVSTVTQAYWNLVSATLDVETKRLSLAQAQKLFEDNQKQVEIGTMAPIETVRAEAQVATSTADLFGSEGTVLTQETNLKNLLSRIGLGSPSLAEARIVPTDRVRIPDVEPIEPLQDVVQRALGRRPDLKQTQVQIENSQINMTGTRNAMLPTLNAFTQLRNSGVTGLPNVIPPSDPRFAPTPPNPYFVGGYGNVLGQLFARNFPTYAFGVQLTVPLRNRAAQADYTTASLQLRQAELNYQKAVNQVRADVQNALTAVQQARARYQAATKARALQEQTLDAEEKKNALGASTVYNVILIQRDLANARQAEVTALVAYAQAKLQMDVAAGAILERNNIQIDEAKAGRVSRPPDPIREPLPNGAAIAPGTLAARP